MKKIKVAYILLIVLGFLAGIYLIIFPLKHEVQYSAYDVNEKIEEENVGPEVDITINNENDSMFKMMFFIGGEKKDNLFVELSDSNGNEVFQTHIEEYEPNIMFFEFPDIKKGTYNLIIKDEDGDDLYLPCTKSNSLSYFKGNEAKTLKIVISYKDNYYFYLWYPLFLLAFLITIYPFVWEDKHEK